MAERAAADTTSTDPGTIAYQRFVAWSRNTSGRTGPVPESVHRESWIGGGEQGTFEQGEGPPVRRGEVVQTDLDPPRPTEVETQHWENPDVDPPVLADEPSIIDLYLQVENGPSSDYTYCLERAGALLGDRPRTGAERAAVLQRLAALHAIEYRGEVIDRAGRPSLAFSARTDSHGGLSEVVVLFDRETGAVNGREDLQLSSVEDVEVGDEPVLMWSQTVLAVANVDAVGERPA